MVISSFSRSNYVAQEGILSAMVEMEVGTPVKTTPTPTLAHSAPSKQPITMRARLGDKATTKTTTTTTARVHSQSSGSLMFEEAGYDDLEDDISWDGEEGGRYSRPRGHSSTMESREVRRSSLGEMSTDEERGRSFTGAKRDMMLSGADGDSCEEGAGVPRNGGRPGSRTGASWKWDFKGWTNVAGDGRTNANGVVMGQKPRARKG